MVESVSGQTGVQNNRAGSEEPRSTSTAAAERVGSGPGREGAHLSAVFEVVTSQHPPAGKLKCPHCEVRESD